MRRRGMNKQIVEMKAGIETAYIDYTYNSNLAYRPQFITNNYKEGKKVLSSLEEELSQCDEFFISVAFVTMGGIVPLLQILKDLEERNIPGKILTTDYLFFNEPAALEKLASFQNIKLKMFCTNSEVGGFHTKGYIFKRDEIFRFIIGSSNMTSGAITKNREWNTKFLSTEQGEMAKEILKEFHDLWSSSNALFYEDFIDEYKVRYKTVKEQKRIAKQETITSFEQYKLEPNKMQVAFIRNLKQLRAEGAKRALLLSATGERDIFMTSERNLEFTRGSVA